MLATLSSDWLMYTSQLRARSRWILGAAGNIGQTVEDMTCGPMVKAWEDPALCPAGFGNYSGLGMAENARSRAVEQGR